MKRTHKTMGEKISKMKGEQKEKLIQDGEKMNVQ